MKLADLCGGVYPSCTNIKSQANFIDKLFEACGGKPYISDSYKKGLFKGDKPFAENQKEILRSGFNLDTLISFWNREITDVSAVLIALGIPEKKEPNKKALSIALAQQMSLLISSAEEDVEDVLILQYQQAKQNDVEIGNTYAKPLYPGDSVSVTHNCRYEIQSFDRITHTWELLNTGTIPWIGRKLIYRRGPKDRPEANPDSIDIPVVKPKESIKITTTIEGRGFDGITHCIWEMQDEEGENCFPERTRLFCVTIDAKYKRK